MPIIACYNVSKAYNEHWAVRNMDLAISEGSIFALVGPNGAGKSSTIKMLATLIEPTSGRILIDGYDTFMHKAQARKCIGYLPDHFTLYEHLSIERCLDFYGSCYGMSPKARQTRIGELLKLMSLTEKRNAKIQGLSRGMKQRVGIARALLHSPPILLLDEPAGGLDPAARVALRKLLVRLKESGITILVSSHILSELGEFCDSIAILQQGTLLETGSIEDVQERIGHGRVLYTMRFHHGVDLASRRLHDVHGITDVEQLGNTLKFLHSSRQKDAANLLTDLVQSGAQVTGMDLGKNDIEWVYTSISTDRVA